MKYFLRIYHTIRHIKLIQLYYQIWYRIKDRFLSINWYKGYRYSEIRSFQINVDAILQTGYQEFTADNRFSFIGIHHHFKDRIDWNYEGHGKLWNYNLQYFSYLLDERIDPGIRKKLLEQFSEALLNEQVRPEPYPVSLRIVNILLFYNRYPIKDPEILRVFFMQVNYLECNLEYHLLANHLLENAFSLYLVSLFLDDGRFYKRASTLLIDQLKEQILSDGGHYECSPMYQSILLAKLFLCIEVARQSSLVAVSELAFLEKKAESMLGWMNTYSFPDGSWALMNDSAEGIAPTTQQLNQAADYLHLMPASVQLNESGFRKLSGNNWEIIIKTGNVCPSFQPGHIHSDILSFCLWYKGKQVIVDPGTSTYTISPQRSKERGTSFHNTVSVIGYNQSDVWGGFRVAKRANCKVFVDQPDRIEATVFNYGGTGFQHKRIFIAHSNILFIVDEVSGYEKFKSLSLGSLQFDNEILDVKEGNVTFDGGICLYVPNTTLAKESSSFAKKFNQLQSAVRITYPVENTTELQFHFL